MFTDFDNFNLLYPLLYEYNSTTISLFECNTDLIQVNNNFNDDKNRIDIEDIIG